MDKSLEKKTISHQPTEAEILAAFISSETFGLLLLVGSVWYFGIKILTELKQIGRSLLRIVELLEAYGLEAGLFRKVGLRVVPVSVNLNRAAANHENVDPANAAGGVSGCVMQ